LLHAAAREIGLANRPLASLRRDLPKSIFASLHFHQKNQAVEAGNLLKLEHMAKLPFSNTRVKSARGAVQSVTS
jgi:hypothetical protein